MRGMRLVGWRRLRFDGGYTNSEDNGEGILFLPFLGADVWVYACVRVFEGGCCCMAVLLFDVRASTDGWTGGLMHR